MVQPANWLGWRPEPVCSSILVLFAHLFSMVSLLARTEVRASVLFYILIIKTKNERHLSRPYHCHDHWATPEHSLILPAFNSVISFLCSLYLSHHVLDQLLTCLGWLLC